MTKYEKKITKSVCRLPAQNTSTTKLENTCTEKNVLCLQLHGVFPKSSQVQESYARGHLTLTINHISFSKADTSPSFSNITASARIQHRLDITHLQSIKYHFETFELKALQKLPLQI